MERLDALEDRCAVVGDDDFALGRLDLQRSTSTAAANAEIYESVTIPSYPSPSDPERS